MNISIKFFITIVLLTFYTQAFCQLSGYYTVGEIGDDYETLQSALSDLHSQGINSDVIFAMSSGTYSGFTLYDIPGASFDNWFTLQSATLDSADVIFTGKIKFMQSSFSTIKAVTISTFYTRAIDFFESFEIVIDSCSIYSDFDDSYDAPIYLSHYWNGDPKWSRFSIKNCIISSPSTSIYTKGNKGRTNIFSCIINSTEGPSIVANWSRNININNNTINGGLDVSTSGDSNLRGNEITGMINIGGQDSVLNNSFYSDEQVKISSGYFYNNHFPAQQFSHSNPGQNSYAEFIDNYFEGKVRISRATDIEMVGNTFLNGISMGFSKHLLFTNNLVYGDLSYGSTSLSDRDFKIHNNIFSGGFILGRGHFSDISYNNFLDSAYLYVEYTDIKVHDNNFCRGIDGYASPENINHNNYYPLIYCYYDTSSIHYDPEYSSDFYGIATNPMLQGKGKTEAPMEDLLGNVRKNPPAIGANEIYVCSDSMNNEIAVACGDEVYLNLCSIPDTGTYWWTPDSCLNYPDSSYTPIVAACSDITYYLYNSVYGLIDSVEIMVEPFQIEIAPMPIFYCGYARTLNATYNPSASYHWSPEVGLSNPNIRNPKLLIEDTTNMQYILECYIDGCGTSYDTLNIEFDGYPHAVVFWPDQIADTVFFLCTSTCTDEYLWDFGDGSFSSEQNPYHIYSENGNYEISLTVTNDYGSNTYSFIYNYYYVSIPTNKINDKLKVYPNPAKNVVFIRGLPKSEKTQITILNLSGKPCINSESINEEIRIDISELKNGLYIIKILVKEQIITRKLVVNSG